MAGHFVNVYWKRIFMLNNQPEIVHFFLFDVCFLWLRRKNASWIKHISTIENRNKWRPFCKNEMLNSLSFLLTIRRRWLYIYILFFVFVWNNSFHSWPNILPFMDDFRHIGGIYEWRYVEELWTTKIPQETNAARFK